MAMVIEKSGFSTATHNGSITIRNPETGGHRTFRIWTQAEDADFAPGERILSLLVGSDNESDYQGFAFVQADGKISLWKRYRDSGPWAAYAKMVRFQEHYEARGIEYMIESRCRKCNRPLTNPESIESGIGPVCAEAEAF